MFRILIPIFGLLGLAKFAKQRKVNKIRQRLEGKTPAEARELIFNKVSQKASPEKAEAITDRIVARFDAKGILAADPAS